MDKKIIVILDGFVANSGDLSWDGLKEFGELTVYDRSLPEEVIQRAKDAWAVFINKVNMTEEVLRQLPKLKFLGVLATGYNNVDIAAAKRLGITVCNVPAYSSDSVAQLVFALLLDITNRVGDYSASVKEGEWSRCKDFSYRLSPITELAGMTMGIVGFGNIGQRVATIASALGMNVITTSAKADGSPLATRVTLDELLSQSDVLSLNAALTPATKHIINADNIAKMKHSAIIINTARGGLVDEQALAEALNSRRIAAAGVDVLNEEPPRNGSPLIDSKYCVVTPHIAWQSTQARMRLVDISVDNLRAFVEGTPKNVVE
jgi:glycerate dehydrogenase